MEQDDEEPKLSRDFLVGMLRAALRPRRINSAEVRKVLRAIVWAGYRPYELWKEALMQRPDNYDPPPLFAEVMPKDMPREEHLDLQEGETLVKQQGPEPRSKKTPPAESTES